MSEFSAVPDTIAELPIHPTTGLRALAVMPRSGRIVWPVMGGSGEGAGGAGGEGAGGEGAGGAGGEGAGGGGAGGEGTGGDGGKPTETVEFWRGKARDQENRAKANAKAASELADLQGKYATAEAEVASVPAKVAEALKTHLVALHKISDEDSELFLTGTDPELLLKQIDGLIAKSGKRRNSNYVPGEGNTTTKPDAEGGMRDFVTNLFDTGDQ